MPQDGPWHTVVRVPSPRPPRRPRAVSFVVTIPVPPLPPRVCGPRCSLQETPAAPLSVLRPSPPTQVGAVGRPRPTLRRIPRPRPVLSTPPWPSFCRSTRPGAERRSSAAPRGPSRYRARPPTRLVRLHPIHPCPRHRHPRAAWPRPPPCAPRPVALLRGGLVQRRDRRCVHLRSVVPRVVSPLSLRMQRAGVLRRSSPPPLPTSCPRCPVVRSRGPGGPGRTARFP